MKAFINNLDWADEGDVFFFSVETEQNLLAMRKLLVVLSGSVSFRTQMYWGTNQWFDLDTINFLNFIDDAVDISEEELAVFNKFRVSGFDIYGMMLDHIDDTLTESDIELTEEELNKIQFSYITLFGEKEWDMFKENIILKE